MSVKFTVTKKGYSPSEVDEYIAAVKREYEAAIIKQRDRIAQLVEENKQSEKELESYREKSGRISKAIESAVEKAEEIERLSRLKYSQEIARLKAFHEKWTKYYEKILDEYPLDSRLSKVGEFNRKMDKILSGVNETAGANETASVAASPSKSAPVDKPKSIDPLGRIDKHFSEEKETVTVAPTAVREFADRGSSGFSFEEALNPTEDLESILKDLGLFTDD